MTEEEFLRQVTAAPELKSGCVTREDESRIAFMCLPTSETAAPIRGHIEKETGRFFVPHGTGKTLREAIKRSNGYMVPAMRYLHPAQVNLDKASSDFEVLQRLTAIANSCHGPHWRLEPDSAEYQAGLRAEAMENVVRAVSLAIRAAILDTAVEHPEVREALEAIVAGHTAKAYRLLFGEDLF